MLALVIWLLSPHVICRLPVPAPPTQARHNLLQMALAMHNYAAYDGDGAFPPAAGGKGLHPGLSWRVALLPYVEEDVLYRQFHLDEPWDSPNNIKLLPLMPNAYALPGANDPPGMTRYRVLVGKGTLFEPLDLEALEPRGRRLRDFKELANAILVVESADPVPWTRPDELDYDPAGPLPALSTATGGPRAVMGDCSVRVLDPSRPAEELRKLIAP